MPGDIQQKEIIKLHNNDKKNTLHSAKIDLFKIFNNFILNDSYPFIQYLSTDGTPYYRYKEKSLCEQMKEVIIKWFDESLNGINFIINVNNQTEQKYVTINLNNTGMIEYIQQKEDTIITKNDEQSHQVIKELVNKINRENNQYLFTLSL